MPCTHHEMKINLISVATILNTILLLSARFEELEGGVASDVLGRAQSCLLGTINCTDLYFLEICIIKID